MGFYDSLKEISASKNAAAQNAQQAAATMAELRLKGAENLNKNLQGIGNAIMDYAKVRYAMDKDARDEAFKRSELDEKTRQFDIAQENQTKQFRENLTEITRQFDAQKKNRDADAAYTFANAGKTSAEAQKISAVNKIEAAVEAAQKKAGGETQTTPKSQSDYINEVSALNLGNGDTSLTAGQGKPQSTQTGAGLFGIIQKTSEKFNNGKFIAQDDKNAPRIPSLT